MLWNSASLPRKGTAVICGATIQSIPPSWSSKSSPMFTAVRRRLELVSGLGRAALLVHVLNLIRQVGGELDGAAIRTPRTERRASR